MFVIADDKGVVGVGVGGILLIDEPVVFMRVSSEIFSATGLILGNKGVGSTLALLVVSNRVCSIKICKEKMHFSSLSIAIEISVFIEILK